MEVYLESQESLREVFIDLRIVKEILTQAVRNVVSVWNRNLNVCLAKRLEKWKFETFDDFGVKAWMSIVKVNVKRIGMRIKVKRDRDLVFCFWKWKEFVDGWREGERMRKLVSGFESGYQNEIKQIEIDINEVQLKNDELSKVHAHFVEREMVFCKKLNELKTLRIRRTETENIEEKIQYLQDDNYELEFKVHAAEYCLKSFLSSTKSSTPTDSNPSPPPNPPNNLIYT